MAKSRRGSSGKKGSGRDWNFVVTFCVVPYLVGALISWHNLDTMLSILPSWLQPFEDEYLLDKSNNIKRPATAPTQKEQQQQQNKATIPRKLSKDATCLEKFMFELHQGGKATTKPLANLSIALHRNGQSEPCGLETASDDDDDGILTAALQWTVQAIDVAKGPCPDWNDKYAFEAMLTRALHLIFAQSCPSQEQGRSASLGLHGYCDMGPLHTPILQDHDRLVPIYDERLQDGNRIALLPCHFHTNQGVRVTSLESLVNLASRSSKCDAATETCSTPALHLYAVPAGRMFIFAPNYIGERIDLPHVRGADPTQPVYLRVMSLSPRVFDLFNFFTPAESAELVERAHQETRESHRIKRSSTGASGYTVNPKRTSESGYDTEGKTALQVKRRCFDVLGFDEYLESHADGLQMLRYNLTKSYVAHMDYIDGNDMLEHDYDSSRRGGNRFATILLYMTDLGENDGGETVFTEAWPVGQEEKDHVNLTTAIQELRASGDVADLLKEGSWEEDLTAKCRSRLSIRPHAGRAVLFYSQHPNGHQDRSSMHGGCPVLSGTKYAANLWVWSTPREGYPDNPKNPRYKGKSTSKTSSSQYERKTGFFKNSGKNPKYDKAQLFFKDTFWAKLGKSDPPVQVNTYEGHEWNLKVEGKVVKTWHIEKEKEYKFVI